MLEASTTQTSTSFEDVLARQGHLVYTNVGPSMLPYIKQGKTLMYIRALGDYTPKRLDAVLYKRGDKYLLHRIIWAGKDSYVLCGDNQWKPELGVKQAQIIGVLDKLIQDGQERSVKDPTYKAYVHLICDLFPIRALILGTRGLIRRVIRKTKSTKPGM